MPDDDAPLARSRFIRDRAAELRRQFDVITALREQGVITRDEEIERLEPIMDEVERLTIELHRRMIAPPDAPELQ